jgi:hypothetical protein
MVRDMMDAGGTNGDGVATLMRERQRLLQQHDMNENTPCEKEETHGQVVFGRATTYVGATHFMAMLDDASYELLEVRGPLILISLQIEDLKSYFDDDDEEPEIPLDRSPEPSDTDMLLISSNIPMSKQEILNMLPPKAVVDRLIQRYFGASSPTARMFRLPPTYLTPIVNSPLVP